MQYKWTVLTNTTLSGLMSSINMTIVLISLPAIFRGLSINPLAPGEIAVLLWVLMGYSIVTATLLVTFGRLSDMYGRVKLYIYGFLIFTACSILLSVIPSNSGNSGAFALIGIRLVQAVGGGLLMVNGAALITDAFPVEERGKALGINQVSFITGSVLGLILGGLLSIYDWHMIFLFSVPFAVAGTVWAMFKLKETSALIKVKMDYWGNITLVLGLVLLSLALTYTLIPYSANPMGWKSPFVISGLIIGTALILIFAYIEIKAKAPMLAPHLFKLKAFLFGNLAATLASLGRGAVMFLVVIWLQGIYLPLHGISYANAPFIAALYMIPIMAGTVLLAPVSGFLTDRYGARPFATAGMIIFTISLLLLAMLNYNFNPLFFEIILFISGIGSGMFASPNTTAIMDSVPKSDRASGNGVRITLQNIGQTISMVLFFTILITIFTIYLPGSMYSRAVSAGLSQNIAMQLSKLSPSGLLFASFIGVDPLASMLNGSTTSSTVHISTASFLPYALAPSFMKGMAYALYIAAAMAAASAIFSALRGGKYILEAARE